MAAVAPDGPGRPPARVLHVTEAPLGGVVSVMEELLRDQAGRGLNRLEVVTPDINTPALGGIDDARIVLTTLPCRRGSAISILRLTALAVRRARATRPDILHVHSTIAGAAIRACRPLIPSVTRIVYCPHGWAFVREGNALKNRAIGLLERALSHASDAVICVSETERRDAKAVGISDGRTVVIENGIGSRAGGASRPAAERTGVKTVVFAGRFDRQKGFDTYVDAMRMLGDEARGLAIGRAIVSSVLLDDLPGNIELLGWQPRHRVAELFAEADLLLMPSRWEGFPMVALEAMAAGVAVFASHVGGLPDIVVDGETGHLLPPDDAAAIATRVRACNRPALRAMGEAGRARWSRLYTAERMCARTWNLYSQVLDARRNPSRRKVTS